MNVDNMRPYLRRAAALIIAAVAIFVLTLAVNSSVINGRRLDNALETLREMQGENDRLHDEVDDLNDKLDDLRRDGCTPSPASPSPSRSQSPGSNGGGTGDRGGGGTGNGGDGGGGGSDGGQGPPGPPGSPGSPGSPGQPPPPRPTCMIYNPVNGDCLIGLPPLLAAAPGVLLLAALAGMRRRNGEDVRDEGCT